MAMLFADLADEPVTIERVLELVAVHDLVEIYAGDTFCYDVTANLAKASREQAAADKLFGMLPAESAAGFRKLWDEFESAATPEARFANAVDRLLPLIQHRTHGGTQWLAHGITRDQVPARIAPIADISIALHGYAQSIVEESVRAGWLLDPALVACSEGGGVLSSSSWFPQPLLRHFSFPARWHRLLACLPPNRPARSRFCSSPEAATMTTRRKRTF